MHLIYPNEQEANCRCGRTATRVMRGEYYCLYCRVRDSRPPVQRAAYAALFVVFVVLMACGGLMIFVGAAR